MSAVYHDFSLRLTQWESKEKHLKNENNMLKADSDDSKLQLKRIQEVLDTGDDVDAINLQLVRLGTVSTHFRTQSCISSAHTHIHTRTVTHTHTHTCTHTHTHTHTHTTHTHIHTNIHTHRHTNASRLRQTHAST